jgi:hypothetical protein
MNDRERERASMEHKKDEHRAATVMITIAVRLPAWVWSALAGSCGSAVATYLLWR